MTMTWRGPHAMMMNTGEVTGSPDPEIRAKKFTELWTRKESVVKWLGTGLNCDLKEILNSLPALAIWM